MPTIKIHPLRTPSAPPTSDPNNLLPPLLHTPSGLAMIELQGSLTTSTPNLTTPIHLGHLVFPDPPPSSASASAREGQRVHLFIGDHQRMTGEMKPLARPVAVVRRRGGAPDAEDLEIAEVVYYKILFAHRPEPVGALGAEGGGDGGDGEEGGGRG